MPSLPSHLALRGVVALSLATFTATTLMHPSIAWAKETLSDIRVQCDGGDAESCTLLGVIYMKGLDVPKDEAKAWPLLQKGCAGGDAEGCFFMGAMSQDAGDGSSAASSFEKACRLKKVKACGSAAILNLTGKGGAPRDPQRASRLLDLGCAGRDWKSCHLLARILQAGKDLPKDPTRAAQLMRTACEGGIAKACGEYAIALAFAQGVPRDPPRAAALVSRKCEEGEQELCGALGFFYEKGIGVRRDRGRAGKLYENSCQAGFDEWCKAADRLGRGDPDGP